MSRYIKNSDLCDYCGELAKRPRGEGVPERWASGERLHPLKNKANGVMCADCRWWDFDDFCRSQGCSANNPSVYIP